MEGRTPLGIFALVTFSAGAELGEEDLALLEAFGDQIRLMLHNAQVFESFGERYLETVKGLARALDARRAETAGHHQLVSDIAAAIAAEAGLDPDAVDAVATAGLIHDVGLAGSAEGGWAADVEHPTIGASLVTHLPLHPGVAEAVATHHEWFDGWGFPNGLKGEAIAPEGRALAAAEFIVELTTPDAVRPGWQDARLAEELRHRRGSQFDPAIADAALRILERGELPLPEREASA
jgi:HD-GYP domain-containing protein (c-di-GMP phosphodiesterase class II)